MLVQCLLAMQDLNIPRSNARALKSCVMTKKINDNYYLGVKNSMYPNIEYFNLAMLKKVYHEFVAEGKMGLEFMEPKKLLTIDSKDKSDVYMLYNQIKDIIDGKKVNIATCQITKTVSDKKAVVNPFDPTALKFVAVDRFDNCVLNMRHLTTLVLEKCTLPTIPVEVGNLPITYLSISDSKLPTNQDTFWNWTSITTICDTLTTLKMDSIDMKRLPFEIMFLKNLQTLSAAKNELSYLPHFIGELKKLKNLFVNENLLVYFPRCLSSTIFNKVDLSNNLFLLPRIQPYDDHLLRYLAVSGIVKQDGCENAVKLLYHLALYNLMDNSVPFKRQDIPRTLWIYFNLAGRCYVCDKWILPHYSQISYIHSLPTTVNLIQDQGLYRIPWQSMSCSVPKNCRQEDEEEEEEEF
uniref:Leucine-rich repeat protein 1 n=1 Tax=Schizaphis graminum TaxID=13262 RepID=A0A2S2PAV2_SCHGA